MTIAIHTPGNDPEETAFFEDETAQPGKPAIELPPGEELIGEEEIAGIKNFLREIFQDLRHISMETKFSSYRQFSHNDSVQENNNYNWYMVLLESFVFVAICAAQVYYIKNFLENKRVI